MRCGGLLCLVGGGGGDDALFRLASSQTPKPLRELLENSGKTGNAKHLVKMLPLSRRDKERAWRGFLSHNRWGSVNDVLSCAECEEMIEWARPLLSKELDSVDGAPEFQTTIEVGSGRLPSLASLFPEHDQLSAFVRCYSVESRPRLPFHVDSIRCERSASVNLSPDLSYAGGDLLLFADESIVKGSRMQGTATVHDAKIAHGISDVVSGERWSLVIFQYISE